MQDPVAAQYESHPYPARDPGDEAQRLIEGSPSHPVEIDHFLFGGRRDWSAPFRALVAGGGTGDGLVMLAQKLADIGCPAEISYLDLSTASRAIAQARMAARGLTARFVTGDLLTAPELGAFDYIDCCGVLHHLPDPDAGFAALAAALAPGGGIGLMVYAPYGRTGVYPLQAALATLTEAMPAAQKLERARAVLAGLPPTNWFLRNPFLGDHRDSDAGLYDLLLHSRDRAYAVPELLAALSRAGLALAGWVEPARYDPALYLPQGVCPVLEPARAATLAEQLAGNMKTHIAYVARPGQTSVAGPNRADAVPQLRGVTGAALAREIAARGVISLTTDGLSHRLAIPRTAAALVAAIDGRRSLAQIAGPGDWLAFSAQWAPVHRALTGFNLLHYSRMARR